METVRRIIAAHGGLAALREQYLKVENRPYMPLVIELLGEGPRHYPLVSVAHTYLQNGDVMYDPELVFEVCDELGWEPISFCNHGLGVYQEGVWRNDTGALVMRPKLVLQLRVFARQWDYNLKAQGYLEAYERMEEEQPRVEDQLDQRKL
jgi:hypothetical protein